MRSFVCPRRFAAVVSATILLACAAHAAEPNYVPSDTYPNVSNFHRVVVHGSTLPMEWLRLTISPGTNAPAGPTAFGPFSWQRVQLSPELYS